MEWTCLSSSFGVYDGHIAALDNNFENFNIFENKTELENIQRLHVDFFRKTDNNGEVNRHEKTR